MVSIFSVETKSNKSDHLHIYIKKSTFIYAYIYNYVTLKGNYFTKSYIKTDTNLVGKKINKVQIGN